MSAPFFADHAGAPVRVVHADVIARGSVQPDALLTGRALAPRDPGEQAAQEAAEAVLRPVAAVVGIDASSQLIGTLPARARETSSTSRVSTAPPGPRSEMLGELG